MPIEIPYLTRSGPAQDPKAEERLNQHRDVLNVLAKDFNDRQKQAKTAPKPAQAKQIQELASIGQVNSLSTGAVLIWSVDNPALLNSILIDVYSADSITVGCKVSVGTNSAAYDNIVPITDLADLKTIGDSATLPIKTVAPKLQSGVDVYLNITTGATGTAQLINVSLNGSYDKENK